MPFADRCLTDFTSSLRSDGERFFREGRIQLNSVGKESLLATVEDASLEQEVFLDWRDARDGYLDAGCTCRYFQREGICKHIWATLLSADAQGIQPGGKSRLEVMSLDPDEWDLDDELSDDSDDDRRGPWGPRTVNRGGIGSFPSWGSKSSGPRNKAGWQQFLSPVFQSGSSSGGPDSTIPLLDKSREVWYVLDVGASQSSGDLEIALFQREMKQSGEFGKFKRLAVRKAELDQFTPVEDRELLRLLLTVGDDRDDSYGSYPNRYGYYYGYSPSVSEISLPAGMYEHLAPRLCATGRLLWASSGLEWSDEVDRHPVAWDDGPPWRFRLNIVPDDKKQRWQIEGQLVREGAESPVPLAAPVLLLSGGLVLFEDRLARLETGDFFPWIVALRSHPVIEVPYKDRWQLLERFWRLPSRPEIVLPENLRGEEVQTPPQGHLVVHSPNQRGPNRYFGDVEFRYDDKGVAAGDLSSGIVDAEKGRILIRDHEKERELLGFLARSGVQGAEPRFSEGHNVWIPSRQFSDAMAKLVEAGWLVEAEGRQIRKAGEWRMSLTSGVDWFDLEGTFDFEGATVQLPELLKALRHGEKYVQLGDGSRGLLPEDWVAQFAALSDLGEAEDGHLRFRPSQALLLDALLAAQKQVSFDEQFAHFRTKLRSFKGVSQPNEPRGFHGELRNYQKEGLGWLYFLRDFRLGGCLADDMGLGKTVQVLALLQSRRLQKESAGPSLVVVPRSVVFNWIEEAQRFTPNLRVLDYTGLQRANLLKQAGEYDLLVTTYGTLCRDITRLKDVRFDYVILDEAQAIKNAQSQRAKACRLVQSNHRLAMTGTPVENHLGELWSLFEFLNPGMLGRSSVFQQISKRTPEEGHDLTVLRRGLAPFLLRRTKEQVLTELPEKTEQTLFCDLAAGQRKRYNELRDYYRATLTERVKKTGLAKAKIHVLEALLRLRQAACHPGLIDKKNLDESSAKLDALLAQLAEVTDEGHKALVFSQFTSFLSIVRRRLDAEKITYEYLDGRTRNRKEHVDRFQNDPNCRLFLISLKAGGHGLNLTAADYVFILDPWWNPAVEAQAVDRAHRIGQSRRVFAYRLIARDTVEEKILELQKSKRDLAEAIVSADGNVLRNLTAEDLEMLLT